MIIDSPIISGSLAASGSLNQVGDITITGSLTVTGNIIGSVTGSVNSASFATVAGNAQLLDNKDSTEFAVTSSNTFTGQQRITDTTNPTTFTSTASLYTDGGLRVTKDVYISGSTYVAGNFTVFGTSSIEYVTSSTFIGLEYIDLNTDLPALRYAGIRVYDSGSPSESTSSLLWDSQNNKWIYSNPSTVGYSGGMLISGPRNTGSLGNEQGTTNNALMKGQGGDHITSSQVIDNGTTVSIPGNLDVTGSIIGSLTGTATTASYWSGSILNATSASFASTASFALNVPLTSSFALTASYWSGSIDTASFALTASYATNAGAGAGFPFSGSAVITGSLQVTNLTGSGTAYLIADSTGSILRQNASTALRNTQAFTSSAGQTTFAVTNGYTTGYVDVFINGTKLSAGEFTDTSGTNIVLATGSFSGDIVEVVKYLPADGVSTNVLRTQTNFIATAGQTVFSASYAPGLLDIFYNGSRLSFTEYTANNGTYFTLATASNAGDVLDVFNYSYKIGGFTGIGGNGGTNQLSYFSTTSSITGSPNLTFNGSTLAVTGAFAVFTGSAAEFQVNATGVRLGNAITDAHTITGSLSMSGSFSTVGTITAQTLVVQTVTSSVVYSSGSNVFGNSLSNIQTFTGSVLITGSMQLGSVINSGVGVTFPLSMSLGSTFGTSTVGTNHKLKLFQDSTNPSNTYGLGISSGLFEIIAGGATGEIAFFTSGSEKMRINAAGNVGIGTSSPSGAAGLAFVLNSGASQGRICIKTNSSGDASGDGLQIGMSGTSAFIEQRENDDLTFATNATERIRITSSGNVGIGVTSPAAILEIKSSSATNAMRFTTSFNAPTYNVISLNATNAEGQYIGFAGGGGVDAALYYQSGNNGNHIFRTGDGTNFNERMRITSDGAVGIGTSSPSRRLHVSAAVNGVFEGILVENTVSNQYALYQCKTGSSGIWQWGVWNDNSYRVGISGVGDYLTITSGGRGLFGTTTPSAGASGFGATSFHVENEIISKGSTSGLFWENRSGGTTNNSNWYGWYTLGGTIYLYNGAGNIASINSSNGTYTALSDLNKKKDFELYTNNALNAVLGLKPTLYRMKDEDETTEKHLGFIAQEVKDYIPQAYVETIAEEKDGGVHIGLNYQAITTTLVKAIQEQQTLITELQEKLERNNII